MSEIKMEVIHPSRDSTYQVGSDNGYLVVAVGPGETSYKIWLSYSMCQWIVENWIKFFDPQVKEEISPGGIGDSSPEKKLIVEKPEKEDFMQKGDLVKKDLTMEKWREYDFGGRVYRIDRPDSFVYRIGGSTHRVVDSQGKVHCLPAPGFNGCVLRWRSKDSSRPVAF